MVLLLMLKLVPLPYVSYGGIYGDCDFVLPSSTYAQPELSPNDNLSGLVWVRDLESSRNSFCNAVNVKFLVFNDGSKSRGILPPLYIVRKFLNTAEEMFRDRKFPFQLLITNI